MPVRQVSLEEGRSSIRLYDTSGPQGHDVNVGLPKLRAPWIAARRATGHVGTQLSYARRGEVTPEMEFVAAREGLPTRLIGFTGGEPFMNKEVHLVVEKLTSKTNVHKVSIFTKATIVPRETQFQNW